MSSRPSRSSIRTLPSSNLGTYETHSNSRNAFGKCDLRSSDRYKSLSYSSRVYPYSIAILTYSSNSAQIELFLSFGASRWEVGRRLLLKPGLKLAMLPTITQMRYYGLLLGA